MKGIILAGGTGSRLFPLTRVVSKQLLPVFDKPMLYYPLSTLMLAGIKDILVISTPTDLPRMEQLLGDGRSLGLNFQYAMQEAPRGLAEAFLIGEAFLEGGPAALILGDNLFFGEALGDILESRCAVASGATIFATRVQDPTAYGVVEIGPDGKAISIEEKPLAPKSDWAVTGLYIYDSKVTQLARRIKPSGRKELEITDLNRLYLEAGELSVERLGRGYAWFDTGTPESLMEAGEFIRTLQKRQGLKIACIEEIAYLRGYITAEKVEELAKNYASTEYASYLLNVARSKAGF